MGETRGGARGSESSGEGRGGGARAWGEEGAQARPLLVPLRPHMPPRTHTPPQGTSRGNAKMTEIVDRLRLWGINMLFVIGGNGGNAGRGLVRVRAAAGCVGGPCTRTHHPAPPPPPPPPRAAAHAIAKECEKQGVICNVVGVPKSIDNDIQLVRGVGGGQRCVGGGEPSPRVTHPALHHAPTLPTPTHTLNNQPYPPPRSTGALGLTRALRRRNARSSARAWRRAPRAASLSSSSWAGSRASSP